LSFSIKKGEIFGYIGPNGAGKTTTLKILVGLIQNYEGVVRINGSDIKEDPTELYRNIGYLPQECGFQEWRTVKMALNTFGKLSGMTNVELNERIPEVLSQVGLTGSIDRKIAHLSGGMKQKLRLAQALLHKPEILILDEPMSGLDPMARFQMKQIIKELLAQDITILLSSHILSDVEDITTNIGIINQGKIIKIGTPAKLQEEFDIEKRIQIQLKSELVDLSGLTNIEGVLGHEVDQKKRIILHLDPHSEIDPIMHNILQFLVNHQCSILQVKLLRPNLEQVYLQMIGGIYE
jgi:ABC-2 type transport system ATP-binding protein